MEATNRQNSQVLGVMAIHLLSLTESTGEQHTNTYAGSMDQWEKSTNQVPEDSSHLCGYMASQAVVIRPLSEPSVGF